MRLTNEGHSCDILLHCWILDISDTPFPVNVQDSSTVGHLKESIMKGDPTMFTNVDSGEVVLWKVRVFYILTAHAANCPLRYPSRWMRIYIIACKDIRFSTTIPCRRLTHCRTFSLHLSLLQGPSILSYELPPLVSVHRLLHSSGSIE
jgi:hypothetical protein